MNLLHLVIIALPLLTASSGASLRHDLEKSIADVGQALSQRFGDLSKPKNLAAAKEHLGHQAHRFQSTDPILAKLLGSFANNIPTNLFDDVLAEPLPQSSSEPIPQSLSHSSSRSSSSMTTFDNEHGGKVVEKTTICNDGDCNEKVSERNIEEPSDMKQNLLDDGLGSFDMGETISAFAKTLANAFGQYEERQPKEKPSKESMSDPFSDSFATPSWARNPFARLRRRSDPFADPFFADGETREVPHDSFDDLMGKVFRETSDDMRSTHTEEIKDGKRVVVDKQCKNGYCTTTTEEFSLDESSKPAQEKFEEPRTDGPQDGPRIILIPREGAKEYLPFI